MTDRYVRPLPDDLPGKKPTDAELEETGADEPAGEDDPTTSPVDPEEDQ